MELVRGRERERSHEGVDQEKKEREGGEGGREKEGGEKREEREGREEEGERATVAQLLLLFSQFVISPTQQGML